MKAKGVVTILKRRLEANRVDSMQIVGDVAGAYVVIVDDMIDTGYSFLFQFLFSFISYFFSGTLCKAAGLLKEHGAFQVYAVATHGIFSGNAMEKINDSCLVSSEIFSFSIDSHLLTGRSLCY